MSEPNKLEDIGFAQAKALPLHVPPEGSAPVKGSVEESRLPRGKVKQAESQRSKFDDHLRTRFGGSKSRKPDDGGQSPAMASTNWRKVDRTVPPPGGDEVEEKYPTPALAETTKKAERSTPPTGGGDVGIEKPTVAPASATKDVGSTIPPIPPRVTPTKASVTKRAKAPEADSAERRTKDRKTPRPASAAERETPTRRSPQSVLASAAAGSIIGPTKAKAGAPVEPTKPIKKNGGGGRDSDGSSDDTDVDEERDRRKHVRFDFIMSIEQVEQLEKAFPGYRITSAPKRGRPGVHPHPMLSAERRLGEDAMFKLVQEDRTSFQKTIVSASDDGNKPATDSDDNKFDPISIDELWAHDWGGNAKRHEKAKRRCVWCQNPILDAADEQRNKDQSGCKKRCNHTTQECYSLYVQGNAHTFEMCGITKIVNLGISFSVHAIYYFSPQDIAELLNKQVNKVHYALLHHFSSIEMMYGTFFPGEEGPEANYTLLANGNMEMSVRGNTHTYKHSGMGWLYNSNSMVVRTSNGAITLCWKRLNTFITTSVFRFCITSATHKPISLTPLTIAAYVISDNYYGPVDPHGIQLGVGPAVQRDVASENVSIVGVQVAYAKAYAFGPFLIWSDNKYTNVPIPKGFIQAMGSFYSSKPRNTETLHTGLAHAQKLMKKFRLPSEIQLTSSVYAAYIAFSSDIDMQNSLYQAHITNQSSKILAFNEKHSKPISTPWLQSLFAYGKYTCTTREVVVAGSLLFMGGYLALNAYIKFKKRKLRRGGIVSAILEAPHIMSIGKFLRSSSLVGEVCLQMIDFCCDMYTLANPVPTDTNGLSDYFRTMALDGDFQFVTTLVAKGGFSFVGWFMGVAVVAPLVEEPVKMFISSLLGGGKPTIGTAMASGCLFGLCESLVKLEIAPSAILMRMATHAYFSSWSHVSPGGILGIMVHAFNNTMAATRVALYIDQLTQVFGMTVPEYLSTINQDIVDSLAHRINKHAGCGVAGSCLHNSPTCDRGIRVAYGVVLGQARLCVKGLREPVIYAMSMFDMFLPYTAVAVGCLAACSLLYLLYHRKPHDPIDVYRCYRLDGSRVSQFANEIVYHGPIYLPMVVTTSPPKALHSSSTVVDLSEAKIKQNFFVGLGILGGFPPLVYQPHPQNELISIINRACAERSPIDKAVFGELNDFVFHFFDELFPGFQPQWKDSSDFLIWNSRFPLDQQARHNAAIIRVHNDEGVGRGIYRRSAFVKVETSFGFKAGGYERVDGDPRTIMSCTDEYNAIVGPRMYKWSKELARSWNIDHFLVYTSGMNANDLGRCFTLLVAIAGFVGERDCVRFDKNLDAKLLKMQIRVYNKTGLGDIKYHLTQSISKGGFTRHGIYFATEGTRGSGEPDTSCGNTSIHGLSRVFAVCTVCRTNPVELAKGGLYMLMLMGDDELEAIAPELIKRAVGGSEYHHYLAAYELIDTEWARTGITPEGVVHEDSRDATYCSGLFWPTTTGYVYGPKVGRMLSKSFWYVDVPEKYQEELVYGDLLGRLNDYHHVPLARAVVQAGLRVAVRKPIGDFVRRRLRRDMHKIRVSEISDPTDETFDMFERRYGVSRHELDTLEELYLTIDRLPVTVISHIIERIILVDNDVSPDMA